MSGGNYRTTRKPGIETGCRKHIRGPHDRNARMTVEREIRFHWQSRDLKRVRRGTVRMKRRRSREWMHCGKWMEVCLCTYLLNTLSINPTRDRTTPTRVCFPSSFPTTPK